MSIMLEVDEDIDVWEAVPSTAVHKFDADGQPDGYGPLPDGFIAYVVPDHDSPNPRHEYHHLSRFVTNHTHYDIDECDDLRSIVRHFAGYRDELIPRACRLLLDAVAVRSFNTGNYGEATVWAYIDRATAIKDLVSTPSGEPEAVETFLATDVEQLAHDALSAEINEYEMWASGEVYGVVVEHPESGREATLWGCYDDAGWKYYPYLRTVVDDLLHELT